MLAVLVPGRMALCEVVHGRDTYIVQPPHIGVGGTSSAYNGGKFSNGFLHVSYTHRL
jgi:hypothetical protein